MNTGSNRKFSPVHRRRMLLWRCICVAIALIFGNTFRAHGQSVASRFPDASQIAIDFPDEAERYVVLNLLWDTLREKAPAATEKRSVYYRAAETIRQKYMVMGGAASAAFEDRYRRLHADPSFRRSVLAKYHLENLPMERAEPARRNTDVTDAMIKGAFLKASPIIIASILLMLWLARIGVRKASTVSAVKPPAASAAGLPALPEPLRVVSLPCLKYSVEMESGLALEKETTLHTSAHTSTTGGQVYTVGNEVHSTPIQSSTSVMTTQKDLVWVRTAKNQEQSWTFTGGAFKVRPGHIISAITPETANGSTGFLLVYNHNTGQLEQMGNPHGTRSGGTWLLVTLAGSVGFAIAIAIILSIDPNPDTDAVSRLLKPVVYWIMGMIPSAMLAFFMVMKAKTKLCSQRNADFQTRYMSQFRQFLEQCSPALQKHFQPL